MTSGASLLERGGLHSLGECSLCGARLSRGRAGPKGGHRRRHDAPFCLVLGRAFLGRGPRMRPYAMPAPLPARERPLSPHLQVYQLYRKIAPLLSILHRLTGVALYVGGCLFVIAWLGAAAYGAEAFAFVQGLFASPLGYLVLFGWTVVLFYHLSNGVRHLTWDSGRCVTNEGVRRTGYTMLAMVTALTAVAWGIGLTLVW